MTAQISGIDAASQQASDDLHTTQQKAQAVLDAALVMVTAATAFKIIHLTKGVPHDSIKS
jgi:hypothetical protein